MEESIEVRYTFVLLLAICDPTGHVIGTDVAIARRLNMPVSDFQRCIEELKKPDPHSNSKEEDGKRVIESDGERGYLLVNYLTYREMKDEEQRRDYMREYMRKYRNPKGVAAVNSGKPKLTQAEVEEGRSKKSKCTLQAAEEFTESLGLPTSDGASCFHKWEGNGWKNGQNPVKDWKATIRSWQSAGYLPSQKNGKQNNGTNHQNSASRNRNTGTLNEGISSRYRGIGKVTGVPDLPAPDPKANED